MSSHPFENPELNGVYFVNGPGILRQKDGPVHPFDGHGVFVCMFGCFRVCVQCARVRACVLACVRMGTGANISGGEYDSCLTEPHGRVDPAL